MEPDALERGQPERACNSPYPLLPLPQAPAAPAPRVTCEGVDDFPRRRAHAYWENLLAIEEAHKAMVMVAHECDKAGEQLLFVGSVVAPKRVSLDEFAATQTQNYTKVGTTPLSIPPGTPPGADRSDVIPSSRRPVPSRPACVPSAHTAQGNQGRGQGNVSKNKKSGTGSQGKVREI